MLFKDTNFYKIIISTITLIFSLNFLFNGFNNLSNNQSSIKNQIDNLIEIPINENLEIHEENKSNSNINLLKINNDKNTLLVEKIIIVKKNDTFSKIIDPYFDNKNIKNLIIKK